MHEGIKTMLDLTQDLSNPALARNYVNEAFMLASGMLRERFVDRAADVLEDYIREARERPPREISLIYAIKPYLPDQMRDGIEKAVEMFIMFDVMTRFANECGGPEGLKGQVPLPMLMLMMAAMKSRTERKLSC